MNNISISRRKFAHLLGVGAAAAIVKPAVSFAAEAPPRSTSTGVVRLSSNENPYGPSPKALKAMTDSFGLSCRYPDEHNDELIDALAKLNGVSRDQIVLGGCLAQQAFVPFRQEIGDEKHDRSPIQRPEQRLEFDELKPSDRLNGSHDGRSSNGSPFPFDPPLDVSEAKFLFKLNALRP